MIRSAIQALLDADAQVAEAVVVMEEEIDHMNHALPRPSSVKVMEGQPGDQPAGSERDHHCPGA